MGISKRVWAIIAGVVVLVLLAVGVFLGVQKATTRTITAYFPSVSGLYSGDPVRVIGVNIGKVSSIETRRGDVKVTMRIDDDTPIPADARAVIVAQSLVSGRFIQLTPVYDKGAKLQDGDSIPMERTAVPMEWDDVKKQLDELTKAVGPHGAEPGTAADAINVMDKNLSGNGQAIADSIKQMSTVMGTLSDNRDDVFATIKSLQKLTDALSTSHEQLVQFNGRMASVSSVLEGSSDDLGDAMTNLNEAVGELEGFLGTNSGVVTSTMSKLAQLTGTLKRKDEQLRGLLHSAPNQLANFFNIYNPLTGSLDGVFGLGMGNNLITLLCGSMASTARPGDTEKDIEQCVDIIGPVMKDVVVNYPPFMANPVIGRTANPDQITYQNESVKQRAQAGVRERDAASRNANPDPLGKLLVPFGGEG
ncbi:MCE family protein [Gordonia sp. PS3]|uniref:Mce family protein n=1 Tax=Gordonia sihwensis NBRC 108236 TaxID=1223544 RepID=L7LDY7_9ACTN|nr:MULTISPECIES: MCE family protein [Gordonia]AUH67106.1 MCE family protein [Gordonia sp. YC-JH1]KXT58528.1 mammalian cell entry protein [Gordonia sp. QH-12]GAC59104.1 Mce family protein [Gordonia sihwensis NBRC 108236]